MLAGAPAAVLNGSAVRLPAQVEIPQGADLAAVVHQLAVEV
jgi:hypothetical protein